MIGTKKVLALITARGGSKGVPGKNIAELAGKPLIAWTIEAARQSAYIDRVALSSDDPDIIAIARQWKCEVPFVRPAELARDDTSSIDVIHHAQRFFGDEWDYLVLLQPTSPLRIAADIDACIEVCAKEGAPACVSVTPIGKPLQWLFFRNDDGRMVSPCPSLGETAHRQGGDTLYSLNGSVYVADWRWISQRRSFLGEETRCYPMPPERSIDIDVPFDLFQCSTILAHRNPDE